jgi:hypothetical protein
MEPFTLSVGAVLALVDWKKVATSVVTEGASRGAKGLTARVFARVLPDEQEKLARAAIGLFTEEFLRELEGTTALSAAMEGYGDQLKRLIEHGAAEIAGWMRPDVKDVDLGAVRRMWEGLKLDALPEDFDWAHVAGNYERAIRRHVRADEKLREQLVAALLEEQTELQRGIAGTLERAARPEIGLKLREYRYYLRGKCERVHLSSLHTSTYDRRVQLWSVFVAQYARESVPIVELPPEQRRAILEEGLITSKYNDRLLKELREAYISSPRVPVLDIIERNRLVVILGDPGSGKTSLLKSRILE